MRHPLFSDINVLKQHVFLPGKTCDYLSGAVQQDVALVTGATGFIGGYLLRELIRSGSFQKYYCLIRCNDPEEGKRRLKMSLVEKGLSTEQWANTEIIVVCGDILKHHLGLSVTMYENLCRQVDHVYHFAATMNWVTPFNQNTEENLNALRQVLHLCRTVRAKKLHYASSMGLWTLLRHESDIFSEDAIHECGDQLAGGYFQSKWVAELILKEARLAGIQVYIYRIGDVKGSAEDGSGDANNFGNLVMHYFIKTGKAIEKSIPEFNFLPVDYVARSIAHISTRQAMGNFQFSNSELVSFSDISAILKSEGFKITKYGLDEWVEQLSLDKTILGRKLNAVFKRFTPGPGWCATSFYEIGVEMFTRKHDTTNTTTALSGSSIAAPAMLSDGTLNKYLHYLSGLKHA